MCASSAVSNRTRDFACLSESLRSKGVTLFECTEDIIVKKPESVAAFIAQNKLECVLVISSHSENSEIADLQYSIERAGLGRLAVGYLNSGLLWDAQSDESSNGMASKIILTNLARLEHADYIERAVLKTVLGPAKISRRQLLRSVPRALRVESDIPITLNDRCDHRSATCRYCKDACPVSAISLTKDNVVIDGRLCVECGACARDCPIGAIQSPSISDAQTIATLTELSSESIGTEKRVLLLTCPIGFGKLLEESERGKHLGTGVVPVQIPCVASIGSMHYLWAASLAVELVTVCPDSSCRKTPATLPMHEHVSSARNVLKALRDNKIATFEHLSLNVDDSIIDSVTRVVESTLMVGKLVGASVGPRRATTVDVVRRLAENGEGGTLSAKTRLPFFDMEVDETRCTLCESCQKVCPDHAIEFVKNGESLSLLFDPSLCGGCMLCEGSCPEHAIAISRLANLSSILDGRKLEKASDENAKCERCGTILGPKRNLVILREKLSEQGSTESILRALNFCNKCKHLAVFSRLEGYSTAVENEHQAQVTFPHIQQKNAEPS